MRYRVVLIFADAKSLAGFVESVEPPGEVESREATFIGDLSETQIKAARSLFGAYVKVVKEIE